MSKLFSGAPLTPPSAPALMRLYHPGSSAFISPRVSLLTHGIHAAVEVHDPQCISSHAQALLDEVAHEAIVPPLVLGAVPFSSEGKAKLFVPDGAVTGLGARADLLPPQAAWSCERSQASGQHLPAPDHYCQNVQEALQQISGGALQKVVLSRAMRIAAQVDIKRLLQCLMSRNLLGYTFSVDLMDQGRALVGASPELLLSKAGRLVQSHPLAGSVPRSLDPQEDQARAQRLLASSKDHREHAFVVDAVAQTLEPHCSALVVPRTPSLVSTPTMWHLGTHITGELNNPHISSLELALALHPTPAVCGYPPQSARAFIEATEGFDRGYFTGLVGWCDRQGDGEWAVTIRCAEVSDGCATLYAGAGIVLGSDPAAELAETTAKMQTMLGAMNIDLLMEAA